MTPLRVLLLAALPLGAVLAVEGGPTIPEQARALHARLGRMTDEHATAELVRVLERLDRQRAALTESRSELEPLARQAENLESRARTLTAEVAVLKTLQADQQVLADALTTAVQRLAGQLTRLRGLREASP